MLQFFACTKINISNIVIIKPFIRVNSLNVTNDHDFYVITVWFDDCFIHVPNIPGLLGLSHGLIHILENTR